MNAQHSDAPDWARRALRVALGLILLAVIGLGLVVTSIVMGVRAASAVVEGVGAAEGHRGGSVERSRSDGSDVQDASQSHPARFPDDRRLCQ